MISKINMNCACSFKQSSSLETDKKINLIYGLNGTGKSTITNFLCKRESETFNRCSIEGLSNEEILVYNKRFIQDEFIAKDELKGIYSLMKKNKDAIQKIQEAETRKEKLSEVLGIKEEERKNCDKSFEKKKKIAEDGIWNIKKNYTGGDRVLEYCLENMKDKKKKLFNHIISIEKSEQEPIITIEQLKEQVQLIQGVSSQKYDKLPLLEFDIASIENDEILKKQIVGNENSTVADFIEKVKNPDWVREGFGYLKIKKNDVYICPFCQQNTITKELFEEIKEYFDDAYENDIQELKDLNNSLEKIITNIPKKESYSVNPFIVKVNKEFDSKYDKLMILLDIDLKRIEKKISSPSEVTSLKESNSTLLELNKIIKEVNNDVIDHNTKIENKEKTLQEYKITFWNLMRWQYDQIITSYQMYEKEYNKKSKELDGDIGEIKEKISAEETIIKEEQEKTESIEVAIKSINNGLIELGIDGFYLEQYEKESYKIVRGDTNDKVFSTLSEGEKMIISFLYFVELCRGKKDATETSNEKIIVIDDPISSLSHIYIFNIGRLIQQEFLKSDKYEQFFLFTHSLYFFYELTKFRQPEEMIKITNLFRITKDIDGSIINRMNYNDIQNDYQAYWDIIKNNESHPALFANCMRNVIKYFFGFVERKKLTDVFNHQKLNVNKYQAFNRYINRESHSDSVNIIDLKDFDYDNFKEAFRAVFKLNGYVKHYNRMMR